VVQVPVKEKDMHRAHPQAGITFIGLCLILIPIGLLIYIILVAAPVYIEAFSVGEVVSSLKKEYDLKEKPEVEIRNIIRKRLEVNDIKSVDPKDFQIVKRPGEVAVSVNYEVKVPLFNNIALALTFQKAGVVR
jgi:hypothetical protein